MRACDRVDSLLSAYIEHEASPAEARFVEGHLTACSRCRDQVEGVRLLVQRLRFLPRVETSPGFAERVLAEARRRPAAGLEEPVFPEVHELPRRRFPVSWGGPLAAAAALAVVTWLGISMLTGDGLRPGNGPRPGSGGTEIAERSTPPAAPLDFDRLDEARRELALGAGAEPAADSELPPVRTLADENPDLVAADSDPAVSMGMASDQYVLEDWVLREPAGGGDPVLTRVGRSRDKPVVVSF